MGHRVRVRKGLISNALLTNRCRQISANSGPHMPEITSLRAGHHWSLDPRFKQRLIRSQQVIDHYSGGHTMNMYNMDIGSLSRLTRDPVSCAAVALLLSLIVTWRLLAGKDPRREYLPPHVPGWPLINQTFVLQQDDPTSTLISWARKYGELFTTTSAATDFIWINSRRAFKELIDKKSAIYSSRHPMPMTLDVVSAGRRMLFMPYGKEWRTYRSIIHKVGRLLETCLIISCSHHK
jgi:hypothetical protein